MSVGVTAEIKSKLDIVEIIGESVPLKKAGTTWKGLCPFHGERTPSFVVTPSRESWHCFGCGLGGDVFSFVMQREGVDFPEALRRLAARAGVELDARTTREDARKKRLRDVMEAAIAFYHKVLVDSRHGQPALDYLRGRGFTDATIETHLLGWSPGAWDTLARTLASKRNVTEAELIETGLGIRGRRGVYDRFRSRVIFPIRDGTGSPTGLGGRILAPAGEGTEGSRNGDGSAERDRGPKYLNSPATPLFDKSRTLYLLDRARTAMRRTGRAVIVEGYTDALMAHQEGFENVVAGLGTALTAGQVELVTRYAPSIALAYDVDPAGQSAGTFGATELTALIGEIQRSGAKIGLAEVGVVRLPEGKDPDEVIRDDRATWESAVAEPQGIVEYLIDYYASRYDMRRADGRDRLVASVLPVLRTIGVPTLRDFYLQRLAARSGVDDRVLREQLAQRESPFRGSRPEAEHGGSRINVDAVLAARDAIDPDAAAGTLDPTEQTLIRLLLRNPEQQLRIRDVLPPELLATTPARELWRRVLADRDADPNGAFSLERFAGSLDPELAAIARGLLGKAEAPLSEERLSQGVDQCVLRLERQRVTDHLNFLRAEVAEAEARHDAEARVAFQGQIRELEQQRAALDRRTAAASLLNPNRTSERNPVGGPA